MDQAIDAQDPKELLNALRLPALGMLSISEANSQWYLEHFTSYRDHKAKVGSPSLTLARSEQAASER